MNDKPRYCSVPGCHNKHYAFDLCCKHYQRKRKTGSVEQNGTERGAPKRFLDQALGHDGDSCLLWPYSTGSHGYGQIHIHGIPKLVHRLVCEHAHGPAPEYHLEAAHSCGNPACLNPKHLSWATPSENQHDKYQHGTDNRTVKNWLRKLDAATASEIRKNSQGLTVKAAAERYGVSQSSILRIRAGKQQP